MAEKKILVCQFGARHRYAMPRMIDKAGCLSALYTDSSSHSKLGWLARWLGNSAPSSVKRLANRKIEGVTITKIYSTDYVFWAMLRWFFSRGKLSEIDRYLLQHHYLSQKMIKWGIIDADCVYSMGYENIAFIKWAKSKGAKIIVDVVMSPITGRIMKQEEKIIPEWKNVKSDDWSRIEKLYKKSLQIADIVICPSVWVADGVGQLLPEITEKIKLVPYGCSIDYSQRVNVPTRGRIFFAGGDPLRKGMHYLGEAVLKLKSKYPDTEMRVAGLFSDEVTTHELCQDFVFLGKLNTEEMKKEFLAADFFVFPSLSEGFAGVVAEAICAGCPVIVTHESGSPIVNEREGLIVPARDAPALERAIIRMLEERSFRDSCARNCLASRQYYSEQQWQNRLMNALP